MSDHSPETEKGRHLKLERERKESADCVTAPKYKMKHIFFLNVIHLHRKVNYSITQLDYYVKTSFALKTVKNIHS